MDFLRGTFVCRNSILSSRPLAQIDQLASLAAKRAIGVPGVFSFFLARWTLHGKEKELATKGTKEKE
jgi:hypothetical protein